MYDLLKERFNRIESCIDFLYVSSHFFVLPVFLSIYMNRYDILWIFTSILLTSLLRWGNNDVVLYQYIDHNWVKIVYLYMVITLFEIAIKNDTDVCFILYASGILFSIPFLFILENIVFIWSSTPEFSVPLHMLLHFYTIIGGIVSLHFDHDFNQTLWLFPRTFQFIYDVLWGTVKMILPATIATSLSRE